MADLVFKKKLNDGRHARLKLQKYYCDSSEYALVALVAHPHRRYANDWIRKGADSKRSRRINATYTGSNIEAVSWATQVIKDNLSKIRQKGFKYLLIGWTDEKRKRVYKKILELKYEIKDLIQIRVELGNRYEYFWVVDLQPFFNIK
jgi:hypothetical protein